MDESASAAGAAGGGAVGDGATSLIDPPAAAPWLSEQTAYELRLAGALLGVCAVLALALAAVWRRNRRVLSAVYLRPELFKLDEEDATAQQINRITVGVEWHVARERFSSRVGAGPDSLDVDGGGAEGEEGGDGQGEKAAGEGDGAGGLSSHGQPRRAPLPPLRPLPRQSPEGLRATSPSQHQHQLPQHPPAAYCHHSRRASEDGGLSGGAGGARQPGSARSRASEDDDGGDSTPGGVLDPSLVDDMPTRIRSAARRPVGVGGARSPQGLRFALPPFVHAAPPTGARVREPAQVPGAAGLGGEAERGRASRSASGSSSVEGALAGEGAGLPCADSTSRRLDALLGCDEGGCASDGAGGDRGVEGQLVAPSVALASESGGLRHRRAAPLLPLPL